VPVPVFQLGVRAPQPRAQLVQEQPRVVPSEELLQHLLGLPAAAFGVDRLEDRDDVLEQEFGVVGAPCVAVGAAAFSAAATVGGTGTGAGAGAGVVIVDRAGAAGVGVWV
jgi:hypothetical protein